MGHILSLVAVFWDHTYFIPKPAFTEDDLPDQTGKVHIITGGYAGIGLEVARLLYPKNATLYLAGRSPAKAAAAIGALEKQFPNSKGRLMFLFLDLGDLTTIKKSADEFLSKEKRLDVLLNNAGIMMPPPGSVTKQGYEAQTGTNVYGPFLFTQLLYPILKKTAETAETGTVRVSWAASLAVELVAPKAGVMFTIKDGVEMEIKGDGSQQIAYGQSKAANVMLAVETARRWGGEGIISNSFNPGNLRSELSRDGSSIQRFFLKAITQHVRFGGYTELFAAFSPEITPGNNGAFVIPWGRIGKYNTALQHAIKSEEEGGEGRAKKLWEVCERVVGTYM